MLYWLTLWVQWNAVFIYIKTLKRTWCIFNSKWNTLKVFPFMTARARVSRGYVFFPLHNCLYNIQICWLDMGKIHCIPMKDYGKHPVQGYCWSVASPRNTGCEAGVHPGEDITITSHCRAPCRCTLTQSFTAGVIWHSQSTNQHVFGR